ncbi:non-heme iron oxygenase ferredoxin subunit [Actinopolymorpha alba]|uniref:non-heme iron oxygenase ferredoxin subunit n=1 Tax=Actinopolymorpha alba TaxID=533267 RepID=UPI002351E649|nr:non-heme iron oxygenase ferredoxin subunit [Actinopolymorpha alba]
MACQLADVPEVGAVGVVVDGVPVAVVRSDDEVHAIHDVCSHAEVALSEGEVDDGEIECWLHGSRFDLASGRPTGLPATEPVPVYPVKIDGDAVLVDVHHPLNNVRSYD